MSGLHLFEACGIELEYMIVDAETLAVAPISDRVLRNDAGEVESELSRGAIAWSNELVMHVVELKTDGPYPLGEAGLDGLDATFQASLGELAGRLAAEGARLMPTAMHPTMDPRRETQLWPHDYGEVYATFDRIFNCSGHGWSNLQSLHVNLPYQGDDELRRLHTAIRVLLPLLPALAASSPMVEGSLTGRLDNRLFFYRDNCRAIPSVTGHVIPEQVESEADYRARVLERIGRDVAPHDPDEILDPEWVNARGAIVRFVRDSIEIRVLDVQEHPAADLAIAGLAIEVLRDLVEERQAAYATQAQLSEVELEAIFFAAASEGERATLEHPGLLAALGLSGPLSLGEAWRALTARHGGKLAGAEARALEVAVEQGPLARRISRALEGRPWHDVYGELADCLAEGRPFLP